MAVKASAARVTAGKILRRGTDGMSPAQLKALLDDLPKVQKILDEIEERRAVFLETEAATTARVVAVEKAEAGLVVRETALADAQVALEAEKAEAATQHQTNMDVMARRTREVEARETTAAARTEALDARENEIEGHGRTRETELSARQEALEAQETAADERERDLHNRNAGTTARETTVKTVVRKIVSDAAVLG